MTKAEEILERHCTSLDISEKKEILSAMDEYADFLINRILLSKKNEPIISICCGDCGKKLTLVRPGKYQCDNRNCTSFKLFSK